MPNVAITGGVGAVGRWVTARLADRGWPVTCIDLARPTARWETVEFRAADLTDQGQAWELIDAADPDAVVHLAAIPRNGIRSGTETFDVNVDAAYNVMTAAGRAGARIVWASSDSAYGMVMDDEPPLPDSLPIDEDHPLRPADPYGTSKLVGEELAAMASRRYGVPAVSIRPTRVAFPGAYDDLREIREGFDPDTAARDGGFWSYVDARDVASMVVRAIEADLDGHEAFLASARENYLGRPTAEVVEAVFGSLPATCDLSGEESVYSTAKAEETLGWEPEYDWRSAEDENVSAPAFG